MNLIQFLTGLLVAGESIILYFVMKYKNSPWLTPMNRAYLVIDIITGLTLLASGLKWIPVQSIILLTSALIHIYRDYEAYRGMENRYAFNPTLLVVLNIRLLALFYVIQNN